MIIECPSCSSRYRIREDKLPAGGGNIKCPNCAHVFFVPRDERIGSGAHPAAVPVPPTPEDDANGTATVQAARPAAADDGEREAPETARPAGPALRPSEEIERELLGDSGDSGSGNGRWKLRNAVGLVYDFPDADQLRKWLAGRDGFDGLEASNDAGSTWQPVEEVEALEGVKPAGRGGLGGPRPSAGYSIPNQVRSAGSGEAPAPAPAPDLREEARARLAEARKSRTAPQRPTEERPKEFRYIKQAPTKEAEKTSKILLILAVLILPFVAAIGLHVVGVINLSEFGLLPRTNAPAPAVAAPQAQPDSVRPERQVEITSEQAISLLLREAGSALERGEPAVAVERLEQAASLDPEAQDIHCQLESLYREAGRNDDADRAKVVCDGPQEPEAEGSAGAPPTPPTE